MKCPFRERMIDGKIACDALYNEGTVSKHAYPISECPQEFFNQCQGCDYEFGKICANQLIYHDTHVLCIAALNRGTVKACPFYHLQNKTIARNRCADFIEGD